MAGTSYQFPWTYTPRADASAHMRGYSAFHAHLYHLNGSALCERLRLASSTSPCAIVRADVSLAHPQQMTLKGLTMRIGSKRLAIVLCTAAIMVGAMQAVQARTQKPALHAQHWMAVTGKPLAATAGAMIFERGGNAVDAACAMIAATSTMWDTLSWGGETQALIYNPHTGQVIGINGLGVAPTGATPAYFHKLGMKFPPEYGPLAAVTPGTPGGLMTMLAEYGTMSLAQVLEPAIEMADGYPMEAELVSTIERHKDKIKEWPDSRRVMLTHIGTAFEEL